MFDSVNVEIHLAFTQLMGNETPCQQSHRQLKKNLIMSVPHSQSGAVPMSSLSGIG